MIDALDILLKGGADARRPPNNHHQVKVSPNLSYYPDTGKIVRDGSPRLTLHGLDALLELLGEEGLLNTAAEM